MTEMFGGDVAQCVSILATFCDGGPVLVKNALKASDSFKKVMQCNNPHKKLVYEFNNSAIFCDVGKEANQMTKSFWNMGMESIEVFMKERIIDVNAVSLN